MILNVKLNSTSVGNDNIIIVVDLVWTRKAGPQACFSLSKIPYSHIETDNKLSSLSPADTTTAPSGSAIRLLPKLIMPKWEPTKFESST